MKSDEAQTETQVGLEQTRDSFFSDDFQMANKPSFGDGLNLHLFRGDGADHLPFSLGPSVSTVSASLDYEDQ